MSERVPFSHQLVSSFHLIVTWLETCARAIAPPLLRVALALPFFRSGLTRWDGFLSLSPGTIFLFEDQFQLHIFGSEYGLPAPDVLAWLTATAEIALPILLLLGVATRFVALALLGMTGVIQMVFPDGWANFHIYWGTLAVSIIALGPGPLSIDNLIRCYFRRHFRRSTA